MDKCLRTDGNTDRGTEGRTDEAVTISSPFGSIIKSLTSTTITIDIEINMLKATIFNPAKQGAPYSRKVGIKASP